MTNEAPHPEKSPTGLPGGAKAETGSTAARITLSPVTEPETTTGQPAPANSLTPEEQMALFEKELKEKDWGHQPC